MIYRALNVVIPPNRCTGPVVNRIFSRAKPIVLVVHEDMIEIQIALGVGTTGKKPDAAGGSLTATERAGIHRDAVDVESDQIPVKRHADVLPLVGRKDRGDRLVATRARSAPKTQAKPGSVGAYVECGIAVGAVFLVAQDAIPAFPDRIVFVGVGNIYCIRIRFHPRGQAESPRTPAEIEAGRGADEEVLLLVKGDALAHRCTLTAGRALGAGARNCVVIGRTITERRSRLVEFDVQHRLLDVARDFFRQQSTGENLDFVNPAPEEALREVAPRADDPIPIHGQGSHTAGLPGYFAPIPVQNPTAAIVHPGQVDPLAQVARRNCVTGHIGGDAIPRADLVIAVHHAHVDFVVAHDAVIQDIAKTVRRFGLDPRQQADDAVRGYVGGIAQADEVIHAIEVRRQTGVAGLTGDRAGDACAVVAVKRGIRKGRGAGDFVQVQPYRAPGGLPAQIGNVGAGPVGQADLIRSGDVRAQGELAVERRRLAGWERVGPRLDVAVLHRRREFDFEQPQRVAVAQVVLHRRGVGDSRARRDNAVGIVNDSGDAQDRRRRVHVRIEPVHLLQLIGDAVAVGVGVVGVGRDARDQ